MLITGLYIGKSILIRLNLLGLGEGDLGEVLSVQLVQGDKSYRFLEGRMSSLVWGGLPLPRTPFLVSPSLELRSRSPVPLGFFLVLVRRCVLLSFVLFHWKSWSS